MMTSFYNLLKYAATGIASPDMTYYDRMRASTLMGGGTVQTLTGIPPLSFKSNGTPLISWSMKGNGSQQGTPTPDNPIMPEFVGVRTGNLFDYVSYFDSTFTNYNQYFAYADLQLSANATYTLSTSYAAVGVNPRNTSFIVAKPDDVPTTASGGISSTSPMTITTGSDGKLRLYKRISGVSKHPAKYQFDNGEWLMLNLGSTALPYEPFGYKIPISCAGQTVPVYLGQVQTVRRIKKLVLTGQETLYVRNLQSETLQRFYMIVSSSDVSKYQANGFCSHFIVSNANNAESTRFSLDGSNRYTQVIFIIERARLSTVDTTGFKAYLAQQYAAGTPVTVWYVLATEHTGIVNEPLCKIGTYADELRSEDAAVTIPTIKGSNTLTVETDLQPSEMTITYKE